MNYKINRKFKQPIVKITNTQGIRVLLLLDELESFRLYLNLISFLINFFKVGNDYPLIKKPRTVFFLNSSFNRRMTR